MAGLDLAACWIDSAHCRMRSRILTLSTPRFERFPECKPLARVVLAPKLMISFEGEQVSCSFVFGIGSIAGKPCPAPIANRQSMPKPPTWKGLTGLHTSNQESAQDEMGQPARRGRIAWKELWKPHFVDCNCCRS